MGRGGKEGAKPGVQKLQFHVPRQEEPVSWSSPALVLSGVLLVFHDQNTAFLNACFSVTFKPLMK